MVAQVQAAVFTPAAAVGMGGTVSIGITYFLLRAFDFVNDHFFRAFDRFGIIVILASLGFVSGSGIQGGIVGGDIGAGGFVVASCQTGSIRGGLRNVCRGLLSQKCGT